MLKLDNSRRNRFETCERRDYWEYERGLKPTKGSTALRYGIVWHSALEGFYSHIRDNGWAHDGKAIEKAILAAKEKWDEVSLKQTFEEDYRTLQNCLRALVLYIAHFNYDEGMLKIVDVEKVFKIPIFCENSWETAAFPYVREAHTDKGAFLFTGRLDMAVELDTRPWHLEQKSTGQSLSVQKSRLHRNPQNIGYTYASQRVRKEPPEGCLIVLHHLSAYKSRTTGLYGEPKIDFDRVPEVYTDGDIESWRISLLNTANRILHNREREIWPMRWDNCYQYGRCPFASLCEQNAPFGGEILEGFFEDEPWDVTQEVPEAEILTPVN